MTNINSTFVFRCRFCRPPPPLYLLLVVLTPFSVLFVLISLYDRAAVGDVTNARDLHGPTREQNNTVATGGDMRSFPPNTYVKLYNSFECRSSSSSDYRIIYMWWAGRMWLLIVNCL
jgi:hypothetical protein